MIKMTSSGYQKLKKHENIFKSTLYGNYLNAPYLTAKEIKDVAVSLGYSGNGNLSCTRCRFNLVKDVAKAYFDFKQKLADSAAKAREAKAEKEKVQNEQINEPISELINE
jgi:hypothetical protein